MRASPVAVVVLTAFGLIGCVEVDGTLDLKPDGSAVNRTNGRVSEAGRAAPMSAFVDGAGLGEVSTS